MKPSAKVRKMPSMRSDWTRSSLKKAYSTRLRARRAAANARRQASFDASAYESVADPWTTPH